jgi:hypothetical protein
MTIEVRPLGAEFGGDNIGAGLSDAEFAAITRAYGAHSQDLSLSAALSV